MSLFELIANGLRPHDPTGSRFRVSGPNLPVSPKTAVTFAMTLHELATNSTKYGALGSDAGYVRVSWTNGGTQFAFVWQECDGPDCFPPAKTSFGMRMLRRALPAELNGVAKIEFAPTGLIYEVEAPAKEPL